MKPLEVVCAVIIRQDGKLLACQRNSQTSLPSKWEFPGGKIEKNESPKSALKREILEELQIHINILKSLSTVVHQYPDFEIALSPYICEIQNSDTPIAIEHSEIRWVSTLEAKKLDWAEADLPVLSEYTNLS